MRTISLLPLTALVAVVAGCGSEEGRQQAARSVPERDLTLVTQTAHVEIASPVETRQPQPAARLAPARRSTREPKVVLAAVATPTPVLAAPEPVAPPASIATTPPNDRELPPGKTITLIPVGSGPSTGSDIADEPPPARGRTMVVGGGGKCRGRGRGRGIGIATGPRPDFR